jgi:hypothetical protein
MQLNVESNAHCKAQSAAEHISSGCSAVKVTDVPNAVALLCFITDPRALP